MTNGGHPMGWNDQLAQANSSTFHNDMTQQTIQGSQSSQYTEAMQQAMIASQQGLNNFPYIATSGPYGLGILGPFPISAQHSKAKDDMIAKLQDEVESWRNEVSAWENLHGDAMKIVEEQEREIHALQADILSLRDELPRPPEKVDMGRQISKVAKGFSNW